MQAPVPFPGRGPRRAALVDLREPIEGLPAPHHRSAAPAGTADGDVDAASVPVRSPADGDGDRGVGLRKSDCERGFRERDHGLLSLVDDRGAREVPEQDGRLRAPPSRRSCCCGWPTRRRTCAPAAAAAGGGADRGCSHRQRSDRAERGPPGGVAASSSSLDAGAATGHRRVADLLRPEDGTDRRTERNDLTVVSPAVPER